MAYSAIPEVNTDDQWSASDHNTYIRDNTTYFKTTTDALKAPPKVRCTRTTNMTSTSTIGAVTLENETFDTDTMFDAGDATKITFTTAGLYLITYSASFSSGSEGSYRFCGVFLSNSTQLGGQMAATPSSGSPTVSGAVLYQFTAGQYITVKVQSGENETVSGVQVAAVRLSD